MLLCVLFHVIFLPVSYKLSLTTSITELTLDFLKAAHLRVVFKITSLEMCPTSIGAIQNVVCAYVEMLLRHYLVRCFEVAILAAGFSFRAIVGKVCIQIVLGYIFCTLVTFDSVNQAFLREMSIEVLQLSCPVAAMFLHCAVNYKGLNFVFKSWIFCCFNFVLFAKWAGIVVFYTGLTEAFFAATSNVWLFCYILALFAEVVFRNFVEKLTLVAHGFFVQVSHDLAS